MRILLVRHAHAGARGAWPGDDLQRALTNRGRAQAEALARAWADDGPAAVHSSRAVRCSATVRPLADRLGLEVNEARLLLEGAAPAETLAWLESLDTGSDDGVVVACSHGDVIGGLVRRLVNRGTELHGDHRWPKASTWELQVDDGLVVSGRLHPPPEV